MKILIIKLSALGDVILSTPFIKGIQAHHAGDEVYLMTSPPFVPLFEGWPDLKVVAFPRKGIKSFFQSVAWMYRQNFDVCYELQANDRTGWMLRLARIPKVVSSRVRYPATHHPPQAYQREIHIFERLNQVMVAGGLPMVEPQAWLPNTPAMAHKVDAWLANHGLSTGNFVIMHAHSSPKWKTKRWPYFAAMAKLLEAQGLPVVWIGAGADAEGNLALAQEAGIDATNQFSINELAELGRRSRFALTNDSGPMHVLSCSGIPVFSFFGPTNPIQSHALGQGARVITHAVECSPCFTPECPKERGHACLAMISPIDVMQRLRDEGLVKED